MRILYHFTMSPFSRRARLALAHKELDAELREGRTNPAYVEEARARVAVRTFPVLVDGAVALGDSLAISHYLDHAYPDRPSIWSAPPEDAQAVFEVTSLVDVALNTLVDLGTRYYGLKGQPGWDAVHTEMLGRAQGALAALADRVTSLGRPTIARTGWGGADIWLYSATAWMESLPARAAAAQNVAQVLSLGWTLPPALSRWADAHRDRGSVRSLG